MPLVIGFFADYAFEELLKVCLWGDAVEPATLRKRKDEGCIFSSILTFPHADSADYADPYIIDVLKTVGSMRDFLRVECSVSLCEEYYRQGGRVGINLVPTRGRLFDSLPCFSEDILDGEGAAGDVDDEEAGGDADMWVLLEIADGIVERFDALGLLVDELHEGIHLTVGYLRRNAIERIIDQMILWEIVCQELAQLGGGAMKEDKAYRCDLLYLAHGCVLLDRLDGLMDEVTRNEDGILTDTGFCQDRFHLSRESGYFQRMTVDISPGRVVIGFLYHRFSAFSLDSKPSSASVLMMNIPEWKVKSSIGL